MRKMILALLIVCMSASFSYAGAVDLDIANIATADLLKYVTKEVGHLISIPSMTPSDPMGLSGFDIGVEASVIELDDAEVLFKDSAIGLVRLHIQKGLPFNIDIGYEYGEAPETNVKTHGGEIRWAIFEDGVATPAIGVRATYSTLAGVPDLDLTTYTLGAQISKEVLFITPYAGVTYLSSKGEITSSLITIPSQKETDTTGYVGINFSALVINLTAQVDFADNPMYTLKLGVGF